MATPKEFFDGSAEDKLLDSPEDFEKRLCAMEYETQFYGFSPFAYYDFIKKYTLNLIKTELGKQGATISKQVAGDEAIKCNSATERLIQKADARVEEAFKKIESKFLSVFSIPPNVLLPEDEIQRNQYSVEDVKQINAEIEDLERRYKRSLCLESFFEEELEEAMALDSIEKKLMKVENKILNELKNKLENKLRSWNDSREILNDFDSLNELVGKLIGSEN